MVRNYAPTFHAFSTALLVGSLVVDVMGTSVVLQSFPWT